MMKVFFLLTLISFSAYSQKLNFEIHNNSLSDYLTIEENRNNKIINSKQPDQIQKNEIGSIKFNGEGIKNKDFESLYIFKKSDSTLISIHNDWEVYLSDVLINNDNITLQDLYKKRYYEIKTTIEEKFGKGMDDSYTESYIDLIGTIKYGIFGDFLWKPNDSLLIKLESDISTLFEKEQEYDKTGKFKISVDIINLNEYRKGNSKALNSNNIKSLDNIKNVFFN